MTLADQSTSEGAAFNRRQARSNTTSASSSGSVAPFLRANPKSPICSVQQTDPTSRAAASNTFSAASFDNLYPVGASPSSGSIVDVNSKGARALSASSAASFVPPTFDASRREGGLTMFTSAAPWTTTSKVSTKSIERPKFSASNLPATALILAYQSPSSPNRASQLPRNL